MQHTLKVKCKRAFPPALLNAVLLRLPILYRTSFVFFETNLTTTGIDELLAQLRTSRHVEGDIIECGSSRCGASIIMARYLKTQRINKKILACDSFEGFDRAELEREQTLGFHVCDTYVVYYHFVQLCAKKNCRSRVPTCGFSNQRVLSEYLARPDRSFLSGTHRLRSEG